MTNMLNCSGKLTAKYFFALLLLAGLLTCASQALAMNTLNDYTSYPPFISTETPPNVIFALDISGSMKQSAYTQPGAKWKKDVQTDYDKNYKYFGYFDSNSKYTYDQTEQFFTADNTNGDWDGNFLNWLTMRRIDVTRKVIVGGKVSVKTLDLDSSSPTYNTVVPVNRNKAKGWVNWKANWDNWYVLEGQNEPFDYQFYKKYSASNTEKLTPAILPDDTQFLIQNQRLIPGAGAVPLSANVEVGAVTMDWSNGDAWKFVPFTNTYNLPRVVAKAQTYNGADPMSDARIRLGTAPNADGTPNYGNWDASNNTGFYVRLQEWDYRDGNHTSETFSYLVVESQKSNGTALGCISLKDDNAATWKFCADGDTQPVNSANCGDLSNGSVSGQQITFENPKPGQTPIIFTGVTTWDDNGDTDALNTRNYNITTDSVTVTIQEQEKNGGNSKCTHTTTEQAVGIAVVPPKGVSGTSTGTWSYGSTSVKIQAGYLTGVTNSWKTLNYDTSSATTTFAQKPLFLAEMQTANDPDPVTIRVDGSSANNNETSISIKLHEEKSKNTEMTHPAEDVGWLAIEYVSGYAIRVGVPKEPIGLVQKVANSMRLGLAVYNYDHSQLPTNIYNGNKVHGGTMNPCYPDTNKAVDDQTNYDICLPTGVADPISNTIRVIEEHPLIWGSTPIAETLIEIKNYVQRDSATGIGFYNDGSTEPTYPYGLTNDPYYYSALGTKLSCAKTFVLHFNDGEPYRDWDGSDSDHPSITGDGDGNPLGPTDTTKYNVPNENEMLDDVAYELRHTDLRTDTDLPGHQEVISYYVLAALGESSSAQYSTATRRLREAAINGGFYDDNDDHKPTPAHPTDINAYIQGKFDATGTPDCTDDKNEWDRDGDCNPDTFYFANDGYALEQELADAFLSIADRSSSGTAASVISNSRSGEGAIYQSIFYPKYDDKKGHIIEWGGELHALFVDAYGNMREDTNGNAQLDLDQDLFVVFSGDTVLKYRDGVKQADGSVTGYNGKLDASEMTTTVESGPPSIIKYLWSSTDWLNSDTDLNPLLQRSYTSANQQRHIFTFIDGDDDMLADSGEVIDFSTTNKSTIAPYLHAYEPFAYTAASPPPGITTTDFTTAVDTQASRLIEWIRGKDQAATSVGTSSVLPAMRSRAYDGGTWRLGDIINSTPTVVGRPAENFDLLYKDTSYQQFYAKYKGRRNVVYFGGNDGMFHAFNAGFYDSYHKAYLKRPKVYDASTSSYVDDTSKNNYDLGAEMWAYVPQNLLPHLYWLSDPDYTHVYYADLKPKIFDANIFPKTGDPKHPHGWGTVLVGGMRFGGGMINADINKDGLLDASDKVMSSSYFVLDITDPESAPVLLAEFSLPSLGYTTNYPMVVAMRDYGVGPTSSITDNDWYLLFGSGPANASGEADATALKEASSKQTGKVFLLNLNKLGSGTKEVCFVNSSGTCVGATSTSPAPGPIASLDANSFISDAIGVDWNLDFKNDAIYFGSVSGDSTSGWGGKLRRIVTNNNPTINATNWDYDNVFLDLSVGAMSGLTPSLATGQPIVAAPAAGLDKYSNRWIFFGTGRFYTPSDSFNSDQQTYYGLKEPVDTNGDFTYGPLSRSTTDLFNSTSVKVYDGGTDVKNAGSASNYNLLNAAVKAKAGWFMDFSDSKERNIGQGTLLGNILTFTTYVPGTDPCAAKGESWVYALDYQTGTAYEYPVIGTDPNDKTTASDTVKDKEKVLKRKKIGEGLSTSPGLHTGRKSGAKAFIQSSTGAITTLEQKTPGRTKSGMASWQIE